MAAYDSYDYPAYWDQREYEHESEVVALKAFLQKIPKISRIVDVGGGFGRLMPYYLFRAKHIILAEPSRKLLAEAKKRLELHRSQLQFKRKKIDFVQTTVEKIPTKLPKNHFDMILMVRVMHHLTDPDTAIQTLSDLLVPGGYLMLEFANKVHGKALFSNFMKGNFTFLLDIFPAERRSKRNQKIGAIPFLNHHPDVIFDLLKKHGFKVLETRSVSNIRSPFVKKHVPIAILVALEELLQKPLARLRFGPSLFVLARKKNL